MPASSFPRRHFQIPTRQAGHETHFTFSEIFLVVELYARLGKIACYKATRRTIHVACNTGARYMVSNPALQRDLLKILSRDSSKVAMQL